MARPIVAYFSITGVTEGAALRLAKALDAEAYEILGQKDSGKVRFTCRCRDLTGINPIYVGLPIWWYAAPTVINDFLEGYDLRGKTVIPFVTSGAGGLDKVRPRMAASCPGADLREASLLTEDMTDADLKAWARQQAETQILEK